MAGGCAVLGHNFPIWLWFKGGKGMATTLGALIVADWRIGICACVLWLITAVLFRYSSLSSLLATAAAPLVALGFGRPEVALLAAFMAVLVWLRHQENIARLLKGQEPKIGQKKN